jgi:hypothetical protein
VVGQLGRRETRIALHRPQNPPVGLVQAQGVFSQRCFHVREPYSGNTSKYQNIYTVILAFWQTKGTNFRKITGTTSL